MCVIDDIVNLAHSGAVTPTNSTHDVWLVAYERHQPLDIVGPYEVFHAANQVADALGHSGMRYQLNLVATEAGPIKGESGLALYADALPDHSTPSGTLLLPGGFGSRREAIGDDELLEWIRQTATNVERVASVCTGTFIAAAAGLLRGKRAATHWAYADRLAEMYPDIDVDLNAIWVRDGNVWSSAGVTAGIDLALALVEEDLGSNVAQEVARWLVVFLRRPGGQSQFSAAIWSQQAETPPIRQAQDLIHADPSADLSIEHLAQTVGMSARHLTRRFRSEVGETPARYVEKVRLEAARQQLEATDAGMAAIARHCGFGSSETLRRSFQRHLGVSPDDYRKRFATPVKH